MSETTRNEITKSEMTKNEFRLFTLKDWQEIERIHRQKNEANAKKPEIVSAGINTPNATNNATDNTDNSTPIAEDTTNTHHTI
ncbi:MAG: hypothetical protein M1561_03910 [Gammaproteobacteria bacterium]|nr:hypothetical protein [Gammaproteobacteria bacterium]